MPRLLPRTDPKAILRSFMPANPLADLGLGDLLPRASRDEIPDLGPEEEAGLASTLGRRMLGGLEMAGNVLGTPGAMVTNLLAGENPLTPLLHPLSGEGRVSGRDLLERAGVIDRNVDQGWVPDEGDLAGFATDILLDPLTYLSFGGSALTRGGAAALKASGLTKGLRAGIKAGERGLVGVGLPFRPPSRVFGTGPLAQKFAGGVDTALDAVRYGNIPGTGISPGRLTASIFSAPTQGTLTREIQPMAEELFNTKAGIRSGVRGQIAEDIGSLDRLGMLDDQSGDILRQLHELPPGPIQNAELAQMVQRQYGSMQDAFNEAQAAGVRVAQLDDPAGIGYFPRHLTGAKRGGGGGAGRVFDATDPSSAGREEALKGILGGTAALKDIIRDPDVWAAIERSPDRMDAARQVISRKHGKQFVGPNVLDRMNDLAGIIRDMPEEARKAGGFGNHPLADLQNHLTWRKEAAATADTVTEALAKFAAERSSFPVQTRSMTVAQALAHAGLEAGDAATPGALQNVAKKMGLDPANPAHLNQAAKMRVPEHIGDDLKRLYESFTTPEAVSHVGKVIDSATSMFKAGVLTWPARYVRDLVSGQFQSFVTGNAAPKDVSLANHLLRGGLLEDGAKQFPEVARMLAARGLPETPENATQALREILYAHEVIGRHETAHGAAGAAAGGIDEMLQSFPGAHPYKLSDATKAGDSWNPFNLRGVIDRKTLEPRDATRFKPVAAGEHIGYYTDSMNRLVPFLHNLEKGASPQQAKLITDALQVSYNPRNYSKTEQQVLKRLFPFYSFSSRMVPSTIRELAERPGGGMAQFVKRSNDLRGYSPAVPDYVSDSTSIGLGEQPDGSKRYITGLGLMHEDPLSLLSSNPKGIGLELLSRLNPGLKAPLEMATGQSFFQKGVEGGRPIEDLDPVIGRTISNLTGQEKAVKLPAPIEQLASNSPLARLFAGARVATDPRKGPLAKLSNLGTGVRVTDVSPATQDATLRELLEQAEKELGAKNYEKVYFPKTTLSQMSPQERASANKLRALSAMLADRAKKRAKEREQKKAERR